MADGLTPDDSWELEAGIVRPYLFTRGRTRPSRLAALPIEAMLTTTALARETVATLPGEQRRIVELCATPQSVAEVAAAMTTPLGVVRVLVSDLYTAGMVDVHRVENPGDDVALLQRLITKVAALT
jgi:Protein of unknown function (DUF742)